MLNGIHLVDYGNHRDTRLTFGRMTALVGQNGAGKTNVLRAIMELGKKAPGVTDKKDYAESEKIRSKASEWLISAIWSGLLNIPEDQLKKGNWEMSTGSHREPQWLCLVGAKESETWVPRSRSSFENNPFWDDRGFFYLEEAVELFDEIYLEKVNPLGMRPERLWVSRYFKTAGSYLQGPSYSERSSPTLSENCRNLAWMIAYLKGDKDEVFSDITKALRTVVPTFQRVRHRPVAMQRSEKKEVVINKQPRLYDDERTVMGQELRFDMASGFDLPASAISEGTLITLAILTAIMYDNDLSREAGTKTILLDDVESGLHPSAQRDLIRQLRRLQETRPELQIIFSSHSPYIIDEMQSEDVWLFAPDKEGIAHCAKLSDHPDAKRGLEVLTTGEFWSAEGEGWVLDPAKRSNGEAVAAR